MTYIDLINAFEKWLETNYLPSSAQLLWYKLIALFNKAGWSEWVTVDNYRLMSIMQIESEKTLIRCRDKLIENNFFEYQKGKKGSPNKYKILTVNFTVQMTVKTTVQMGVKTTANVSNIKDIDIDKELDKNSSSIKFYMENINPLISPHEVELLNDYCNSLSDEMVIYAIKDAIEHNAKNMKYIKSILDRYVRQGISSVEQIEAQNGFNKQPKEETEEEKNARKLRELEEAIRNGT